MNHTAYVSNPIQDSVVREMTAFITSKLQAAAGGCIFLHGETLSGLTSVLYRLCQNRLIGSKSPWLLKMTPTPHLMGVKAALLHAMRLPNESDAWASTILIPRFLSEYLIYSRTKVMLIDDFHIAQKLSKPEQRVFQNTIQALMQPPYSIVFVLAGNFFIFQPRAAGWDNFEMEPLRAIKKFGSSKHVQKFSNTLLEEQGLSMTNLMGYPIVSIDDASAILSFTKGYVGEVVIFLSILAREYKCAELCAAGVDVFSRATSRYRPRNG